MAWLAPYHNEGRRVTDEERDALLASTESWLDDEIVVDENGDLIDVEEES